MALQGWNERKMTSADEQVASLSSTEESAYDVRGSRPCSSDGARYDVVHSAEQAAAASPDHATSDVDNQNAQLLISSEDSASAVPADSDAPDEMWQAGGDAAVHDAPATSSHKAV